MLFLCNVKTTLDSVRKYLNLVGFALLCGHIFINLSRNFQLMRPSALLSTDRDVITRRRQCKVQNEKKILLRSRRDTDFRDLRVSKNVINFALLREIQLWQTIFFSQI